MNQIKILVLFDGKGTTKTAKQMTLCCLILILFYQSIKYTIFIANIPTVPSFQK